MIFLLVAATCVMIVMTMIAIINVFTFPRLNVTDTSDDSPLVSILIPARNEAHIIAQTVKNLLQQSYKQFELLILDDHSTDSTADVILQAAKGDSRLRVIPGKPLPGGWMGKNWACHQLAEQASGDILIFTDADVQWQSDALATVLSHMTQYDADLLTIWPTQHTQSLAERLIIPLMAFAVIGYLPSLLVHHTPVSEFAAANGQCMIWRKSAYQKTSGHGAVADNVLEDVTLARLSKKHGLRVRMADAAGLIQCRMYSNWQTVRDGYAKNILAGYGNNVLALLGATAFHLFLFVVPFFLLAVAEYRAWALALICLGIGVRALSAQFTKQRIVYALLMPISVILMTRIAFQSVYWHYTGGPRWKGRILQEQQAETVPPDVTTHTNTRHSHG